jgi:choice-of-anchor A domain-containing protein
MSRTHLYLFWVLVLALGLPHGNARAGVLSNSDLFGQFNAIIFGNFTTSSEVGGRVAVGGTVSGGGSYDFAPNNATASSFAALSVYGSVTSGGTYNVNGSGGVAIAGSNNATFNLNTAGPVYIGGNNSGAISGATGNVTIVGANSNNLTTSGGSVYVGGNSGAIKVNGSAATIAMNGNNTGTLQVNANGSTLSLKGSSSGNISMNKGTINYTGSLGSGNLNNDTLNHVASLNLTPPASTLGSFATTFLQPLTQLSTQLAGLTANSSTSLVNGSLTFNGHPNSAGVATFNVNSSQFNGASTITLNLGGATSAIINVNVDTCVSSVCAFNPTVNFNDASYASVLLWNFVNATNLNFTTEFGGSILAPFAAITDSSPIDGTVVAASLSTSSELHSYAYTGTFPGSAPAPEPAGLAVFGTGLVGLAMLGRRKR